jgi:hypothetical protein
VQLLFVIGAVAVFRNETDMQSHRVAAEQPGEIGDFGHFREPRGPRFARNQTDGALGCGNVGIALAVETAEHGGYRDAGGFAFLEKFIGGLRRARLLVRRVDLNRGNPQLLRNVEMYAQPCVDRGEYADRPCLHGEVSR